MPSRRTLVAQVAVTVLMPTLSGILAALDPVPYWAILLIVLATILIVLAGIAIFEHIRRPYRVQTLEGIDLFNTIDSWLRDNGFTRGPAHWEGYSQGIAVTDDLRKVWIAKEDASNKLIFISARIESAADTAVINTIDATKWAEMKYELLIELARFGAFYEMEEKPFSVVYWTFLAVDSTLNEAAILEKVTFIQRADALVQLVASKAAMIATLNQPLVPHISDSHS